MRQTRFDDVGVFCRWVGSIELFFGWGTHVACNIKGDAGIYIWRSCRRFGVHAGCLFPITHDQDSCRVTTRAIDADSSRE